jgi:thiamine pyrophosphate-dependent acetolactate synthase large subunit-like protein
LATVVHDEIVVCYLGPSAVLWANARPRPANLFLRDGMSLAIPVALGVALSLPDHHVLVMEGDGSLLMHLGALVTAGVENLPNLTILLFNNDVYESSGGQRIPARGLDYAALALACGLRFAETVNVAVELPGRLRAAQRAGVTGLLALVTEPVSNFSPPPFPLSPMEIRVDFLRWAQASRGSRVTGARSASGERR